MHQHADAGREPRVFALGEDARDGTGEHVTHPRTRHAGIAALANTRNAPRRTDQRAGPLQHDRAAVTLDDLAQRSQAVALDVVGLSVDQARGLARMRREDPVVARTPVRGFRDEIERIRIDDERLVAAQHLIERAMGPRAAAEPWTDG